MHDGCSDCRRTSRLLDERLVAIIPSERDVGRLGPWPFYCSVRSDDCCNARQDLLASLVGADGIQDHDVLGRPLLFDGEGGGDRVVGGNRAKKL